MPGDPSPPRRPRLNLLAASAAALFTLLFLASLRYAIIISPGPSLGIGLMAGGLWLNPNYSPPPPPTTVFPGFAPTKPPPPIRHPLVYAYRHGFSFQWWFEGPTGSYQSWSVPLWPLFSAGAGFWAWRYARRRWARKEWQCKECGYDLRGLKDPVCPECGEQNAGPTPLDTPGAPSRPRRIGQWIATFARRVAIWLGTGALLTILSSWLIAIAVPHQSWTRQHYLEQSSPAMFAPTRVAVTEFHAFGSIRRAWRVMWLGSPDRLFRLTEPMGFSSVQPPQNLAPTEPSVWPVWGDLNRVRTSPGGFPDDACEHATGWPFPAFWYELWLDDSSPPTQVVIRGGIPLGPDACTIPPESNVATLRALPYRPIWPGLLANASLFGAAAWGAMSLLAIARGRRRRGTCERRGLAGLSPGSSCAKCRQPTLPTV